MEEFQPEAQSATRRLAYPPGLWMWGADVGETMFDQDGDTVLTRRAAAARVGVTPATVTGWIRSGYLAVVRPDPGGHHGNIRPADLEAAHDIAHAGGIVPRWRQDPKFAASRLRALRETTGWTQQRLAAETGLTHEAISHLEQGRRVPKARTIRTLAAILGVRPEVFVSTEPLGLSTLSVAETATQLGVTTERVQDWLSAGILEGRKVSGRWRIPAIAVAELDRSGRLRGRSRRLDPRYRPGSS